MSKPTHYMGLHDIANTGNCRQNLSQPKYVATLQARFLMEAASAARLPMGTGCRLKTKKEVLLPGHGALGAGAGAARLNHRCAASHLSRCQPAVLLRQRPNNRARTEGTGGPALHPQLGPNL